MPEKMENPPLIKGAGKQFAIYGLGDFLNKGIAFLLLPIYTHYLAPRDYGVLEMLDLTIFLIGLVLAMGMPQAVMRFYHEAPDPEKKKLVVSCGFLATLSVSLASLVLLQTFSGFFSSLVFKSPEYSDLFMLIFITMALNLGIEIPLTYFRVKEMPIWFISFSTLRLVFSLSLNILFVVFLGMGVKGVLLGGVIASVLLSTVLFAYLIRQVGLGFSADIFRPMLRYGFPLIGTWLGMYLINYGDRFLLQRLLPPSEALTDVGIYSLAYKFGMLPNFLVLSPFAMFWAPKQFQVVREPNAPEIFSRVFNYFIFAQFFVGLGLCALIHEIVQIIAAPQYQDASLYVPVIVLAYVFYGVYMYAQFGLLYRKKTRYLAYNTIAMALLNVALNLILIPVYGIMGAAVATLVAIFLMTLVAYFMAQRLYAIPYQYGRVAKMLALAVALYFLAGLVNPENSALAISLKTAIALLYPALVVLVRATNGLEIATLRRTLGRIIPSSDSGSENP